jgi:hypothetical protein
MAFGDNLSKATAAAAASVKSSDLTSKLCRHRLPVGIEASAGPRGARVWGRGGVLLTTSTRQQQQQQQQHT